MHEGWEILVDPPMPRRALRFMSAMERWMPAGARVVPAYRGEARHLMVYGPGSPLRQPIIKRHLAAGGRVAMWDLGYWDRLTSMRLSLDHMHPTPEQLAMAPAGPGRREFELREDADPDGPILLIGLGVKSVVAYGLQPLQWELAKARELARRFPGREVIWRPKGGKEIALPGMRMECTAPITDLLRGASLVVCRHSNVAVDACVAGVPVECEDGAAVALYRGNPNPTPAERAEFLRRLTFWEWCRNETEHAWKWLAWITRP